MFVNYLLEISSYARLNHNQITLFSLYSTVLIALHMSYLDTIFPLWITAQPWPHMLELTVINAIMGLKPLTILTYKVAILICHNTGLSMVLKMELIANKTLNKNILHNHYHNPVLLSLA